MPRHGFVDTVHFGPGASADGIVGIYDPILAVPAVGVHKILRFHNLDGARDLTIKDWDDNDYFVLKPREYLILQISRDAVGGGELIAITPPERRSLASAGVDAGERFDSINSWVSGTKTFRQIPVPTNDAFNHADAFERGTNTVPSGQTWGELRALGAADMMAAVFTNEALLVKMDGVMSWNHQFEFRTTAPSGTVGSYHFTRLYRLRGTSLDNMPGAVLWPGIDAPFRDTYHFTASELLVEKDDIYFTVMHAYAPSGIAWSAINATATLREVILKPSIRLEY